MGSLLFADDTVLIVESEECMKRMVNELDRSGMWKKEIESNCE